MGALDGSCKRNDLAIIGQHDDVSSDGSCNSSDYIEYEELSDMMDTSDSDMMDTSDSDMELDERPGNNGLPKPCEIMDEERKMEKYLSTEAFIKNLKEMGKTHLLKWQHKLVTSYGTKRANFIFTAPTSAGKSFVAEMCVLQGMERRRYYKALFICPFVSMVREKTDMFKRLLRNTCYTVAGYMGAECPSGGFDNFDVVVATIEKANRLINNLFLNKKISELNCIIMDEIHMMYDDSRGYLLQDIVTKLRYYSKPGYESASFYEYRNLRIIGMTAITEGIQKISDWIGAVLITNTIMRRPVQLRKRVVYGDAVLDGSEPFENTVGMIGMGKLVFPFDQYLSENPPGTFKMDNVVTKLCIQKIRNGGANGILVFCPTKNMCEILAKEISKKIFANGMNDKCFREKFDADKIGDFLKKISNDASFEDDMKRTIRYGVAYHHAGLTLEERALIEKAFDEKILKVIVATSTLSSGVNLPVDVVIIATPNFHGHTLDRMIYHQMIGRCGRWDKMNQKVKYQCTYLVCSNTVELDMAQDLEFKNIEYESNSMEPMNGTGIFEKCLLETMVIGVDSEIGVKTVRNDVHRFFRLTFYYHDRIRSIENDNDRFVSHFEETIELIVNYLANCGFIKMSTNEELGTEEIKVLPLGRACAAASLNLKVAKIVMADLFETQTSLFLSNDLHLLYLSIPRDIVSHMFNIQWPLLVTELEQGETNGTRRLMTEVLKLDIKLIFHTMKYGKTAKDVDIDKKYEEIYRFYAAMALRDILNEKPVHSVAQTYRISKGMLQVLQQGAAVYSNLQAHFCRSLGFENLEVIFKMFSSRLQFGVKHHLLELMTLEYMDARMARALYNSDIKELKDLAEASYDHLRQAIMKRFPYICDGQQQIIQIGTKIFDTILECAKFLRDEARSNLKAKFGPRLIWDESGRKEIDFEVYDFNQFASEANMNRASSRLGRAPIADVPWTANASIRDLPAAGDSQEVIDFKEILMGKTTPEIAHPLIILGDSNTGGASLLEISFSYVPVDVRDVGNREEIPKKLLNSVVNSSKVCERFDLTKVEDTWYFRLLPGTLEFPRNRFELLHDVFQEEGEEFLGLKTDEVVVADKKLKDYAQATVSTLPAKSVYESARIKRVLEKSNLIALALKADDAGDIYSFAMKCDAETVFTADRTVDEMNWSNAMEMIKSLLSDHNFRIIVRDVKETYKVVASALKIIPECIFVDAAAFLWYMCDKIDMNHFTLEKTVKRIFPENVCEELELLDDPLYAETHILWEIVSCGCYTLKNICAVFEIEMEALMALAELEMTGLMIDTAYLNELLDAVTELKLVDVLRSFSWLRSKRAKFDYMIKANILPLLRGIKSDNRVYPTSTIFTKNRRISITNPNIQFLINDVKFKDKTYSVRRGLIAKDGYHLVQFDYCQLELRLLAHFSKDERLTACILHSDPFQRIADNLFADHMEEIPPPEEARKLVKQITYGLIYGMGRRKLAKYTDSWDIWPQVFKSAFPLAFEFLHEIETYPSYPVATTLSGRKRLIPNCKSLQYQLREKGRRSFLNAVISGSASDIVLMAMGRVHMSLKSRGWGFFINNRNSGESKSIEYEAVLVNNIHDELVYEVKEDIMEEFINVVKREMVTPYSDVLRVPLVVKTAVLTAGNC